MNEEKRKTFLIMEKQDNIRELLSFFIESKFNFEPLKCTNILMATKLIKSNELTIVLCGDGYFSDDHRALNELFERELSINKRKILYYDITPFKKRIRVNEQGKVHKEMFSDLMKTIEDSFQILPEENIKPFSPVSFETLPFLKGVDSDLYIRLMPTDRYIKLFREGDVVDSRDVKRYLEKGVKYLYLNQACHTWMMRAIENSVSEIFNDPDYIVTKDFDALMEEMNIDKETYTDLIEKSLEVKATLSKNNNLKALLSNLHFDRKIESFFNNRIKLISMISCGIAKELSWGSDESYRKLILAAHLHDILLVSNPALAMIKTEESFSKLKEMFSEEDRYLFLNHPEMTAKMLEQDPNIPSEVISIIRQHHELSDGSGFPNKFGHTRLKPYSCLFIVSLDLATYILNNRDWKMSEFLTKYRENYKGVTFNKIIRQLSEFKGLSG